MLLAALARQKYLFLAFAKAIFVFLLCLMVTLMTGNSVLIFWPVLICWKDWATAGITKLMGPFF